MEQKHDLHGTQWVKNTKHEFLHDKAKEPIKMLNVFYVRNVIKALFL